MRIPRSLIALTALNTAMFSAALVQQIYPALADEELPMLRGSGLQIVDSQGRVRASIGIMPPEANSADQSETVLLRLITERGRPSAKIAASEASSGLSFAGPTGTESTYVVLKADGNASSLKLRNEDGSEEVVSP